MWEHKAAGRDCLADFEDGKCTFVTWTENFRASGFLSAAMDAQPSRGNIEPHFLYRAKLSAEYATE